jgi:hypothetical protein
MLCRSDRFDWDPPNQPFLTDFSFPNPGRMFYSRLFLISFCCSTWWLESYNPLLLTNYRVLTCDWKFCFRIFLSVFWFPIHADDLQIGFFSLFFTSPFCNVKILDTLLLTHPLIPTCVSYVPIRVLLTQFSSPHLAIRRFQIHYC